MNKTIKTIKTNKHLLAPNNLNPNNLNKDVSNDLTNGLIIDMDRDRGNVMVAIKPSSKLKEPIHQPVKVSSKKNGSSILLLGSSGFIGRHVVEELRNKGYSLRAPTSNRIDFMEPDFEHIAHLCQDIDIVINMIGIMSQNSKQLEQVHHHAPVRIAEIAKEHNVKHWINLSALGASFAHNVDFVGSKGRGDAALLALADTNFKVNIVRPSLIFGQGGASCEMFIRLAKLPILILPKACQQLIQPIHVLDVAMGIVNLATHNPQSDDKTIDEKIVDEKVINATGAEQCTVRGYMTMMRQNIHNKPAPFFITLPNSIAKLGSVFISLWLPPSFKSVVNKDSIILLEEGSIADNAHFTELLGRYPLGYKDFAKFYDPT